MSPNGNKVRYDNMDSVVEHRFFSNYGVSHRQAGRTQDDQL